jgi:hypothetical protein
MNPVITISKLELQKKPQAEQKLEEFADKVSEVNQLNVYVAKNSMQLIEFICFLKDSAIRFDFFANEEELKTILSNPSHLN